MGSFTASVNATELNRYGAAIQLNRELVPGSTVAVRNKRGAEVSVRVVRQVKDVDGVRTYGIEFLDHDETAKNFWGISFPTA